MFHLHKFARQGRNPKTGETVQVLPRSTVHFKPGLEMPERVNNRDNRIIETEYSTPEILNKWTKT